MVPATQSDYVLFVAVLHIFQKTGRILLVEEKNDLFFPSSDYVIIIWFTLELSAILP